MNLIIEVLHIARRIGTTHDKSITEAEGRVLAALVLQQGQEIARLRSTLSGRISEYAAGQELARVIEERDSFVLEADALHDEKERLREAVEFADQVLDSIGYAENTVGRLTLKNALQRKP